MIQSPKLWTWLRRAVMLCTDAGPCTRVVLSHGKATGAALLVNQWPTAEPSAELVERIAGELWECAISTAEVYTGPQLFEVAAYYGRAEVAPGARFAFRVDGRPTIDPNLGSELAPSEDATGKGLAQQSMRHAEAVMRMHVGSIGVVFNKYEAMLERAFARMAHLEERHFETLQTFEELTLQREERKLAAAQLERESKRDEAIAEKIALLMPVIANRIAGQKVFPTPITEGDAALGALVKSLTKEQLAGIAKALDPTQAIALFELVQKHMPAAPADGTKALPSPSGTSGEGGPPNGKGGAHN